MRHVIVSAAVAACAAVPAWASVFTDWNLIVRNDVVTTSEVDGSALVGGSVLGTSNYTTHLVSASNGDGLAVGGNIGAGINIQINNGGNLRISGSVLGTVNFNGGGSQINDPGVPGMVASAMSYAEGVSGLLGSLTPNGSVDGAGNMNAVPTLIDGQFVAVYSISQAMINSLGQLNLNFGSADSVIINFVHDGSGVADLIAPPNLIGGFSQSNSSRILWNFGDATGLLVNNTFNGAALAPHADLQLLGGGMNGTVIVDNISVMNAEIRRHNYDGFVPSPSAAAVLMLSGAMIGSRRRR